MNGSHSKGDILHSMMRRPETARLIKDAINSPVGSTSRVKAKKIFSIMSKLNTSNDGIGGPGIGSDQTGYSQVPAYDMSPMQPYSVENSKGMVIFHKIPKPNITYGKKPVNMSPPLGSYKLDGSGGPGIYDGKGGWLSDAASAVWNRLSPGVSSNGVSTLGVYQPAAPASNSSAPTELNFDKLYSGNYTAPAPGQAPSMESTSLMSDNNNVVNQPSTPLVASVRQGIYNIPNASIPSLRTYTLPKVPINPAKFTIADSKGTYQPTDIAAINAANSGLNIRGADTTAPGFHLPTKSYGGYTPDPYTSVVPVPSLPAPDPFVTESHPASVDPSVQQPGNQQVAGADQPTTQTPSTSIFSQLGVGTARTDRNNNPTAFTTDVAKSLGLVLGKDYLQGDQFPIDPATGVAPNLFTAKLLGDPIETTIRGLDQGGFTTQSGGNRWSYTDSIPGANNKDWANLTHEQKVNVIAQMYDKEGHGGSAAGPSGLAGLAADAAAAVAAKTGGGAFAQAEMAKENGGQTLSQSVASQEKTIWDKYNLTGLQADVEKLRLEQLALPSDIIQWISDRDKSVAQSDKEISAYINDTMAHVDTSDPVEFQKAQSHLNYLYTQRGRQNQTYIGYLNKAVATHQTELDTISGLYKTALDSYDRETANIPSLTKAEYDTRAAALSDMYTAIDEAPLKALQMEALKQQIIDSHAKVVADQLKANAQLSYIDSYAKLKGQIVDGNGMILPKVDLIQQIQKITDPVNGNPEISTQNVIDTYIAGVQHYMDAPTEKDSVTGTGVTSAGKIETAKWAMQQLTYLAAANAADENGNGGDPIAYNSSLQAASDVRDQLASHEANIISSQGKVPQIMEAVKTLAPGGWFFGTGNGTPPSQDQFVKNLTGMTKDPLDESIAKAIYAAYQTYVAQPNSTPKGFVNGNLYPSGTTTGWDDSSPFDTSNPFPPDQFALHIGGLIADAVAKLAMEGG